MLERAERCNLLRGENLVHPAHLGCGDAALVEQGDPVFGTLASEQRLELAAQLVAIGHTRLVVRKARVRSQTNCPEQLARAYPHGLAPGARHDDPAVCSSKAAVGGEVGRMGPE